MRSENGWILSDGRYVECEHTKHADYADKELGITEEELEKTAVKVTCLPGHTRVLLGLDDYQPEFATERNKMTVAQLRTIEKYCVQYGFRPPLDYFFQQGLHEMARMETKTILAILSK